jgi:uncharacterized protein YidB (DUF937 family)
MAWAIASTLYRPPSRLTACAPSLSKAPTGSLGSNIIKTLAQKSGLSEDELAKQLSQVLPGIVDKLTPNGRLPTMAELSQES